jgi:CRISPR-associated protein Csd1
MSILAALNAAYERLAQDDKVPSFGFSNEKISYVIPLNPDGTLAGAPIDIRDVSGKKLVPRQMRVPERFKRSGKTPPPYFLWDNTKYCLGVGKEGETTLDILKRFEDFRSTHLQALDKTHDEGLLAFCRFVTTWKPDFFASYGWPKEMGDANVVFALEKERSTRFLHDRPDAKRLWAAINSNWKATKGKQSGCSICLVTGVYAQTERIHPPIKGMPSKGGAKAADSIVSFNEDSFESYGHERGDNAPVSKGAAFGYVTALNKFLEFGSHNTIRLGDMTVVFWADASNAIDAENAESIFASMFGAEIDEEARAKNYLRPILEEIRNGQPLQNVAPALEKGVRFYILGLAPNAARISIRFWMEDTFGRLMENYQRFLSDMRVEPADRDEKIALWKYLCETAVLGKTENVPPTLAGEWMRSILTGTNYPYTLLATILMRIRADHNVNARRVAILKSILVRNLKLKEVPVAFDPDNRNKGYLLGRLFALYEKVQHDALGNINASIKDKFYGSASAQPRKVFALLESGSANHLSKIGKQKPGWKVMLEKQIGGIMELMTPGDDPFPASLSADQQALFGLGYYHQRSEFFKPASTPAT